MRPEPMRTFAQCASTSAPHASISNFIESPYPMVCADMGGAPHVRIRTDARKPAFFMPPSPSTEPGPRLRPGGDPLKPRQIPPGKPAGSMAVEPSWSVDLDQSDTQSVPYAPIEP